MNVAVLLYQNVPVESKPSGIPDVWPSTVIELGDSTTLPDETWSLMTREDYCTYVSTHQSTYDTWFANSIQVENSIKAVQTMIGQAREFGTKVILEYAAENVLLGITQAGKTKQVQDALIKVVFALLTGSLYLACTEIKAIPAE